MTFTVPPDATVTELLELGSRSLLYFEQFAPRYQRYHGSLLPEQEYASLHARFYQQNGLSEEKLSHTAAMLAEVLDAMRGERDVQRATAQSIAGVWQGQAAATALAMIDTQLALAEADITAVEAIADRFAAAPAAMRTVVRGKAEIVLHILEHGTEVKIDGKTPEDIDVIISGAEGLGWSNGWSENSEMRRLERIFPDIPEGILDRDAQIGTRWLNFDVLIPGAPYEGVIRDRCKHWLDQVFVPDYRNKVALFSGVCENTDRGVQEVYTGLTDALAAISEEKYPQPVEAAPATETPTGTTPTSTTPASTTPASTVPTSTTPTSTTPASTTPASTTPTSTTPTTTVPATTVPTTTTPTTTTPTTTVPSTTTTTSANPLSQLSALAQTAQNLTPIAESVAQSIGTGLSALTAAVTTGVEDAIERVQEVLDPERDTDGDGEPDPATLAEFPLGDQRVRVELEDGALSLTLTGADGASTEYRLETDEQGRPVLVEIGPDGLPVDRGESGADGEQPDPDAPSERPGTTAPDGTAPDGTAPDGTAPDGTAPDGTTPDSTAPDGTADDIPGQPAPGTAQPDEAPDGSAPAPGTAPPAQRREEDGEHQPRNFPSTDPAPADGAPPATPVPPSTADVPGTPSPGPADTPGATAPPGTENPPGTAAPATDSGAELSEAGPL